MSDNLPSVHVSSQIEKPPAHDVPLGPPPQHDFQEPVVLNQPRGDIPFPSVEMGQVVQSEEDEQNRERHNSREGGECCNTSSTCCMYTDSSTSDLLCCRSCFHAVDHRDGSAHNSCCDCSCDDPCCDFLDCGDCTCNGDCAGGDCNCSGC